MSTDLASWSRSPRTNVEVMIDAHQTEDEPASVRSHANGREADVMGKSTNRRWLLIWISLIVVVVVPWGRLQPDAHWERVGWIPFVSRPVVPRDILANVVFYMPYGIVARKEVAETRNPILMVTGSAFLLSVASEFTQVFSASRFPSMTDVVCNVSGALIGAMWATTANRDQVL